MKPAEHVRADVTKDGLVILDLDNGLIFSANAVGARIWQAMILDSTPAPHVVATIAEEWNSTPEAVLRDLETFVESLRRQHLVVDD